jgi:hypothetical protein
MRYVVDVDFDAAVLTLYEPATFDPRGRGAIVPFRFVKKVPWIKLREKHHEHDNRRGDPENGEARAIAPLTRARTVVHLHEADSQKDDGDTEQPRSKGCHHDPEARCGCRGGESYRQTAEERRGHAQRGANRGDSRVATLKARQRWA